MTEHPEWFTTLPDGTIAYAENPPKKYQDIYPINFDNDPEGIRAEVLRIVRLLDRARRAHLPRRQPAHEAARLLGVAASHDVNAEHPDVVFLAEAFTRPAMMQALAQGRLPAVVHLLHLAQHEGGARGVPRRGSRTETADFLRPNLFVNTPDILTEYLQFGGPAAYKIRAAIAATAAPTWGVYSGYELYRERRPPGRRGEHRQREVRVQAARLRRGREAAGSSLAPYLTHPEPDPARRTPRCGSCATSTSTGATTTPILVYSQAPRRRVHRRPGEPDTDHRRRERRPALGARDHGAPRPRPRSASTPGATFTVHDLITGAGLDLGRPTTTCASTRSPSPCTSCTSAPSPTTDAASKGIPA